LPSSTNNARATALLLARVCVSEAGWYPDSKHDCAGIYETALTIRGTRSTAWALRRLSPRATGTKPALRARGRWVQSLRADAGQPVGWPYRLKWKHYRTRWVRTLTYAWACVNGECEDVTGRAEPWAWGMPGVDDIIAIRRGLVPIAGTETKNTFWRKPGEV